MKDIWNFRHPLLPVDAVEFSLRWQFPRLIQRSRHDVSKFVLGTLTILEDTAATYWAELTMEKRARPIISLVDGGLCCRFLGVRERIDG